MVLDLTVGEKFDSFVLVRGRVSLSATGWL